MKINKIFTVIILSIVVFAGTVCETKAINWRDYVPNVSVWMSKLVNTANQYSNRFLQMFLGKKSEVMQSKSGVAQLQKDFTTKFSEDVAILNGMDNLKTANNCYTRYNLMKDVVKYYVKADDEEKKAVEAAHGQFNVLLKNLRKADVTWFEIACLDYIKNKKDTQALQNFWDAWEFFSLLKKFDSTWSHDKTLDAAIRQVENTIVPDSEIT